MAARCKRTLRLPAVARCGRAPRPPAVDKAATKAAVRAAVARSDNAPSIATIDKKEAADAAVRARLSVTWPFANRTAPRRHRPLRQ
jgi:hypothetical protein